MNSTPGTFWLYGFIRSIHLKLFQCALRWGSRECCSLSQLSLGEGGVTPVYHMTRQPSSTTRTLGRTHTQVPAEHADSEGPRSESHLQPLWYTKCCSVNKRDYAVIGNDTFQTGETSVPLQTADNSVVIKLFSYGSRTKVGQSETWLWMFENPAGAPVESIATLNNLSWQQSHSR